MESTQTVRQLKSQTIQTDKELYKTEIGDLFGFQKNKEKELEMKKKSNNNNYSRANINQTKRKSKSAFMKQTKVIINASDESATLAVIGHNNEQEESSVVNSTDVFDAKEIFKKMSYIALKSKMIDLYIELKEVCIYMYVYIYLYALFHG